MIEIKPIEGKWYRDNRVIIAILVVVVIFLAWRTFRESKRDKLTEELIQTQNIAIEALNRLNEKSDSIIANQERRIETNTVREKETIIRYEKIPSAVRDLSRDQLRDEVTNFKN